MELPPNLVNLTNASTPPPTTTTTPGALWNNSQLALVYYTLSVIDNASADHEDAAGRQQVRLVALNQLAASPAILATAILLVFLFSPTIIIGNSLVLIAIYRFKRLRTPSNYLVMSLATSDLGVGMYMPVGMYLELCVGTVPTTATTAAAAPTNVTLCLLNYGVSITLCCVSVLVMVAIAVDRFTSLARPLRYNNLITHTAMERYIAVFWSYAMLVGMSPIAYHFFYGTPSYQLTHCSFGSLVARPIQLFMFCAVYGPSACILLVCYGYIYVVARGHARAISEVRHSLQYGHGTHPPRYGLALAITTGMFLVLWLPFQICMLLDVFTGTKILTNWIVIYLALPILASSAFNPWIYGYRNAELRLAVHKVIDDMLTMLGFSFRSHPMAEAHVVPPSIAATAGDDGSLINHHQVNNPVDPMTHPPPIRREYYSWNPDDDFLLVPIAKPESSGFLSMNDEDVAKQPRYNNFNQLNLSYRSLNNNNQHVGKFFRNALSSRWIPSNRNLHSVHIFSQFSKDRERESTGKLRQVNGSNEYRPPGAEDVFGKRQEDIFVKRQEDLFAKRQEDLFAKRQEEMFAKRQEDIVQPPGLRGSRSMIETFAGLRNGTDVWIFKGKNLMMNGASIV